MGEELWVVRAGEKAKFADEFVADSYIAIDFTDWVADDLSGTDEAALRARATGPAQRNYAGQVISFVFKLQVGDLVIVPRLTNKHRVYLVARVAGPYEHRALGSAGPHRREVRWLGSFSREGLSQAAINTLGAIQTVFRPTAVEPELRS